MQARAVLFDLDGTLLYTLGDIAGAANRVLESHGREPKPVESYRRMVGSGLRRLIEHCIPEEDHDEELLSDYTREMIDAYHAEPTATTEPYPGIEELLDTLSERGFVLATLSNKLDSLTRLIVEETLGLDRFRVVQGALAGVPKKPDPGAALEIVSSMAVSPGETLFVGDSSIDMKTAQNAGMQSCAVTWGYRTREELVEAGAGYLVDTPAEILAIFDDTGAASATGGAR